VIVYLLIKKAEYFSLIFEKRPTYENIVLRTANLSPFIRLKDSLYSSYQTLGAPSKIIFEQYFIDSILILYHKLRNLGFSNYKGTISIMNLGYYNSNDENKK